MVYFDGLLGVGRAGPGVVHHSDKLGLRAAAATQARLCTGEALPRCRIIS